MSTDAVPIFDAALALPQPLRADLAARLIDSLDDFGPPPDDRSPEDWARIIKERSDAIHRGETVLIDGEAVADKLQAIVDRASAKS